MKKMLTLVLVSVLGGAITLGTYKTFLEKDNVQIATNTTQDNPVFLPTNYKTTTTALAAAEGINFTNAADKTVHAVVHVKNVALNTAQPTLQDLFYGRVPQKRQLGTGSGVIISPDGYIITNNHVIEDSQQLSVTLNDNRTLTAKIIGSDPKTDIALLKVESDEQLPYTTFGDSDTAKIGEWVLAVGNPFNLTSTVTAGIISAKSRDLSGQSTQSFIQTDAAVNPGNSGGALVNTAGELIGINTAITSQTGSYIGYSFAVPSNIAKKVVQDIMEFGNVQNGILGVIGGSLNSTYAEKLGVGETEGFYVDDVEEDTGAAEAGIKSGDIIKMIDNIKIKKFSDLRGFLDTKRPNDVVNVTLLRDGQTKEVAVTLLKNNTYILPVIGVIKNAKPEDLKKYKTKNGVKITKVNGTYGQYLQREGIEAGNIITAINNVKVNTIEDVDQILKNRDTYQPLSIELINSKGEKNRYGLR
ncbi:MAG: Do/DeqQ family serine protease [Olleya marilimosa]|jgi:Do/DeqQ family serine protease|uniref:Trypsin-like peptidase domain-containing protein n=1 Tax=Olleya marilimosa TaxID=272164 RepID=A0ABR8LUV8_9FLAO|nr:trypsin-like peptidase domain-containing protein [Olleya marilimosa]MBD3862275.1 trypsin-like peptidase domain-containing protein [Olleya marilimosa]MBD3889770.1 trypsin-like peptidase domain-containing protein [Olleya marilimosa]